MIEPAERQPDPAETVIDCSVLVPVLNEERYIEQTVSAMCRQRFDGRLEFIFADGGSTDRTREILEAHARQDPRIRIFDNPNQTVSSGLNVALRQARGRWVARMDAHTEYPEDYVELGVGRLEQGGTRWVSGPQVPTGHGPVSRAVALALGTSAGRAASRKWATKAHSGDAEYELDSGVFTGVWSRETLLAYGGWDERWSVNEDSEMAGRFLAGGERLVCLPRMAAQYVPRDSVSRLWQQYRVYGEYRAKTARRHPQTMRLAHLLAPGLVLDATLAICGPGRGLRQAARIGLGFYAGVLTLEGMRSLSRTNSRAEALLVPVVLLTMHVAWGMGTWWGTVRYGPPLAALAHVAGLNTAGASRAQHAQPVYAPSLS